MELKFVPFCSSCEALSFGTFYFLLNSKFSDFGKKPWTIVHGFIFGSRKIVLRKVCQSKGNEKRKLIALVSVA